jgi:diamine N-acetyltransferase
MTKPYIPPLESERVRLCLLQESDLPMTLAWRNQDHIRKWFLSSNVITPEQHRAWYAKYRERDDDFVFIIEETQTLRRPVGQVSLYNIVWASQLAEFGRLLIGDDRAREQGLAKEATELILDYGCTQLGLKEFALEVIKGNALAIAIYKSVGFVTMGERDNVVVMRLSR